MLKRANPRSDPVVTTIYTVGFLLTLVFVPTAHDSDRSVSEPDSSAVSISTVIGIIALCAVVSMVFALAWV